jgi:hypothetical protein
MKKVFMHSSIFTLRVVILVTSLTTAQVIHATGRIIYGQKSREGSI